MSGYDYQRNEYNDDGYGYQPQQQDDRYGYQEPPPQRDYSQVSILKLNTIAALLMPRSIHHNNPADMEKTSRTKIVAGQVCVRAVPSKEKPPDDIRL